MRCELTLPSLECSITIIYSTGTSKLLIPRHYNLASTIIINFQAHCVTNSPAVTLWTVQNKPVLSYLRRNNYISMMWADALILQMQHHNNLHNKLRFLSCLKTDLTNRTFSSPPSNDKECKYMFIFYKTIPNFAMNQIFVPLGIQLGEVLHLIQRTWQILQTQVTLTVK